MNTIEEEEEEERQQAECDDFDDDDDEWIHDVEIPGETGKKRDRDACDDDDDYEIAANAMRGGGLFSFDLRDGVMPQRWRDVVHKTRHTARLQQTREAIRGDVLGEELSVAVRNALVSVIELHPTLRPDDRVHFNLQSEAFSRGTNHCFQSAQFRVSEIVDEGETERFATYMAQLARQLNSSQSFTPGDDFALDVTTIRLPEEGGARYKRMDVVKARVRGMCKQSRITIKNDDASCCARAIVTMMAKSQEDHREFPESSYISLRRGFPCQTVLARRLCTQAGVLFDRRCGLEELQRFQQALLPTYRLKVLQVGQPHMIIFSGQEAPRVIRLLLEDEHYDGCTSFPAILGKKMFCDTCDRGFDHDTFSHHPCDGRKCPSCHSLECEDYGQAREAGGSRRYTPPTTLCQVCHRMFFGSSCLTHHAMPEWRGNVRQKSMCDRLKSCPDCCKIYHVEFGERGARKGTPHRCGFAECPQCLKKDDMSTHQCFIQKVKEKEDEREFKWVPVNRVGNRVTRGYPRKDGMIKVKKDLPLFVYADFEAMTNAQGFQEAVLLGYETGESETCVMLGGSDCTAAFIRDVDALAFDQDGDDRNVICVFHNLKGYDGMFILEHLYKEKRQVDRLVNIGAKVLSFVSDKLTFKDSVCFLPFPLAAFSATFNLTELHKGFFPHAFNVMQNQTYRGPMPPRVDYDPDSMTESKRREFNVWYDTRVAHGFIFDLAREMRIYCESDVKLLKAGCGRFVAEFKKSAMFNPMEKCLTIASACNRYWRKCQLQSNTLVAVQPNNGWKGSTPPQSRVAREWLSFENAQLLASAAGSEAGGDRIRHGFNGGEHRVAGFLVDGYDPVHRVVYEFNGCFFHGCPTCFPRQRHSVTRYRSDRSLQECFEATLLKRRKLEAAGCIVKTMWECQWKRKKKEAVEGSSLKRWLSSYDPGVAPLEPRDAFFGGRTNAVRLHYAADREAGEKIYYQDVTSLYPWVNKYCCYPTGHPKVITQFADPTDLADFFGVMKLTILPPRALYHPVLPIRQGGKLTFPLCRVCVETEMPRKMHDRSSRCQHTDAERSLTATWCTPEVREAVARGYVVVKIHEVWHFPPEQRQVGLFANYVNNWLRIKTESSGYPRWADTEEKKEQYRFAYFDREGIWLDKTFIAKNAGRKATAKLMLNSFWGKFGENLRKTSVLQITSVADLYAAVTDPLKEIHNLRIFNDEVLELVYSKPQDECVENGKTNIFVAAFTTCHARLKLYGYLHTLQEQVLYFDTDSVIYSCRPGQQSLENGDFLGDLTDEMSSPGEYIVEFTSGGPKNYGYRTSEGKTECKVRGFSLGSVRGHAQLNYDILRENVIEELTNPVEDGARRIVPVVNPHFFTRDASTKRLRVVPRRKEYGLVFDKRVVDATTFKSFPYGYH